MNPFLAVAMPSTLTAIGCGVELWLHHHYAPPAEPSADPTNEENDDA